MFQTDKADQEKSKRRFKVLGVLTNGSYSSMVDTKVESSFAAIVRYCSGTGDAGENKTTNFQ
jgi:hypothetical protein